MTNSFGPLTIAGVATWVGQAPLTPPTPPPDNFPGGDNLQQMWSQFKARLGGRVWRGGGQTVVAGRPEAGERGGAGAGAADAEGSRPGGRAETVGEGGASLTAIVDTAKRELVRLPSRMASFSTYQTYQKHSQKLSGIPTAGGSL